MNEISRELFEQQRRPRFGNANPERMQYAFWEWMIRGEEGARDAEQGSLEEIGLKMRDGKLKSSYGPYRARDLFQVERNREDGPIWTFDRYGATQTTLPDGRIVCIAGEHEDSYDPDFYIYNDVIVFCPDGEIEIYGFPKEVFPPTDFHSATLVGNKIIIIGTLGYVQDRRRGITPVYSLDTDSYRVSEVATSGDAPGWISEQLAELSSDGTIYIRGGQLIEWKDGRQRLKRNLEDFSLDATRGIWTQRTKRNWPQFSIVQEDGGLFVLDHDVEVKDLIPPGVQPIPATEEQYRDARFLLRDVPIRIIVGVSAVEFIVEGHLPEDLLGKLPEGFRSRIETLCKKKCVVDL